VILTRPATERTGLPLPQPHARCIAVRELDAGGFEGSLDGGESCRIRGLISFDPSHGRRGNLRLARDIPDAPFERCARHSDLSS
jgi:hypothetical protein